MKHKLSKRILSTLLAMVMLIGLLPTAAIPAFAVEESDIYGYDPNYEHGYFLGGKTQWEGGTWVREVYDWDDMDQVFKNLNSATMTNYGYVTIKLMENLELSTATSSIEEYYMKEYRIYVGFNNVIFDFNGHTLSGEVNSPAAYVRNFINIQIDPGNQITFTDSVGGGGINFNAYSFYDSNTAALYIQSVIG